MKKFLTILISLAIACSVSKRADAQQQVNINQRSFEYIKVFDDVDITGATTLESAWINIGGYQYFTLFGQVDTDSTYYTLATNDSLGFDLDYTLAPGDSRPASSNDGWFLKDSTNAVEIMSYAIADTTNNGKYYQSFHNDSPTGSNISPSRYIKFFLDKDAAHTVSAFDLRATFILIMQP